VTVLAAVLIAIASWWFFTGVVIALARQGKPRFRMVMAVVTAVAIAGMAGLYLTRDSVTAAGAYSAFFSALALWTWHETAFLLGLVTGPRRIGFDQAPREKTRFRAAFLAVRDHELALALTAALMVFLMHDAANLSGLFTFLLMWIMRISTKLNIFLGARHAVSDMLPDRLSYLKSYFRTDKTSRWFWFSFAASTAVFASLIAAVALAATGHGAIMWSLLAAFAGLALLEHMFLVLPVRDSVLWSWAIALCPVKNDMKVATETALAVTAGSGMPLRR
jgi:putative photosynthetic complex assembly protein 2